VTVSVSGLTGSGKSAICGEIEIALKAIGLVVHWPDGDEEKRATHADWAAALDRYRPEVLIQEINIARIPPGYFGGDTLAKSKP
jgi:adenylylsulfate kinase-like enzyme